MNAWRYVLFLCGQLGMMALARFFFSWNIKYADQRGPDGETLFLASAVGLLLLAFRLFDGVTDPPAGSLSDAWVRRGHERRTLLWFSFLIPSLGLLLIFAPAHAMGPGLRWALLGGGMFAFFVGYTIYAIPYWSLVADYGGESLPRRRILSTLLGVGTLGATAAVGIGSPFAVQAWGYLPAAALFAGLCAPLMVLPYFARPTDAAPPSAPVAAAPAEGPSFARQMLDALRDRRFVAVLFLFSGSQMAFTVITVAAPFIAVDLLAGTDRDVSTLMGPFLGTALPFFLLTPLISRRFGWERAVVVGSVSLGVVYAGTAALGEGVVGTPMTTAMALFACGGPMAAVLLGLEGEAITECARARPGERTSLYFGVFNLVVKALNGLAMFLTGVLVTLKNEGHGTAAVRAMGLMAGALLVVGVLAYVGLRPRPPAKA